jgi:hypothetical protein
MKGRHACLLAIAILAALAPVRALSSSPQSGAATQSQPAPPSSQASAAAPAPSETPPRKKVWTNDDLAPSRGASASSSARSANSPASDSGTAASEPRSRQGDARWYHEQIAKLKAQIPPLDDKIAPLRAGLKGDDVGSAARPANGGVRRGDWQQQLADLEKKRQDILGRIDALEDEARHKGIAPSELP